MSIQVLVNQLLAFYRIEAFKYPANHGDLEFATTALNPYITVRKIALQQLFKLTGIHVHISHPAFSINTLQQQSSITDHLCCLLPGFNDGIDIIVMASHQCSKLRVILPAQIDATHVQVTQLPFTVVIQEQGILQFDSRTV